MCDRSLTFSGRSAAPGLYIQFLKTSRQNRSGRQRVSMCNKTRNTDPCSHRQPLFSRMYLHTNNESAPDESTLYKKFNSINSLRNPLFLIAGRNSNFFCNRQVRKFIVSAGWVI